MSPKGWLPLLFLLPPHSSSTLTISLASWTTSLNCSTAQASISSLLNATYHQFWEASNQKFNLPSDLQIILPSDLCSGVAEIWPATQPDVTFSSSTKRSQYLGCGEQGKRLELELAEPQEDGSYGAAYVEEIMLELTQHLFGVFPEHGEEDSTMFPLTYLEEDKAMPTSCSNVPVQGNFIFPCSSEQDCLPSPNQTEVTSSLLYSTNRTMFPQMNKFCDSTNHNTISPTPQNLICSGQSVLEVIETTSGSFSRSYTPPMSNWSQLRRPSFSLLMDQGPGTRAHQDPDTKLDRRWTAFRTGWSSFFEAWPDHETFSVFLSEEINIPGPDPTNVTKGDFDLDYWRAKLFPYQTSGAYSANLSVTSRLLELNETLDNLSFPPLIILSASDEEPESADFEILMDIVEERQIPVFLFTFPGEHIFLRSQKKN